MGKIAGGGYIHSTAGDSFCRRLYSSRGHLYSLVTHPEERARREYQAEGPMGSETMGVVFRIGSERGLCRGIGDFTPP